MRTTDSFDRSHGSSNKNEKFSASVKAFSSRELPNNKAANKKPPIAGLLLRSFLIAVCIGLFGYSAFMIGSNAVETRINNELYEGIRPDDTDSAVAKTSSLLEPASMYTLEQMMDSNGVYVDYIGDSNSVSDPARRSKYYKNFVSFAKKYDDAYAWIYVENTKINYPVMKGETNDYYLTHTFNGGVSTAASIFVDSSLSDNFDDNLNNVIYGHCMKNGSMFRTLKTFMESANRYTLAKNMNIEIYTEKGLYIYKVFCGYRSGDPFFLRGKFSDDADYLGFLDYIKSFDTLKCSREYNADSRICTLITCANVSADKTQRYVLHGILTSFISASELG